MTDPISNERLLPCPFCGSADIYTEGPCYTEFMCNGCGLSQNDHEQTRDQAIAAWNRRQSPAGVEVKGLEWEEYNAGELRAYTAFGTYWVSLVQDEWSFGADEEWRKGGVVAAQADYERRILSSLSVKEPEGVEPFGYWCECKGAEPAFLRKPAYIPPTDDLHTTTPIYVSPPPKAATITEEVRGRIAYALTKRMVIDMPTARAAVDEALSSEAHNG